MKGFIKSKKGLALLATFVVVLAAAIGAYAYYTNSGTTTNTTADSVNAGPHNFLTVGVSTSGTALAPAAIGDTNAIVDPVTVNVTNANEEDENFKSITVTVNGTSAGASCPASWFSINGGGQSATMTEGPTGSPIPTDTGITLGPDTDGLTDSFTDSTNFNLQLVESGTNQNACQNATVSLTATANAS